MERGRECDRVFKWPTDLKPTGHKVLDVTYSAPSLINHPHVLQTLTYQHPKYTSQTALTAMISLPLKTQSTYKPAKISLSQETAPGKNSLYPSESPGK